MAPAHPPANLPRRGRKAVGNGGAPGHEDPDRRDLGEDPAQGRPPILCSASSDRFREQPRRTVRNGLHGISRSE